MKTNRMSAIIWNFNTFEGLLPLTEKRPLATIPFDCKYRLIDFQLSNLANSKINSLLMVFNDGETKSVFDHIGSGKEWNLDLLQSHFFIHLYQDILRKKKEGKPHYASMIDYLKKSESTYTVLMESRMLCNIDIRSVLKAHQRLENNMTIVYKSAERKDTCSADTVLKIDNEGNVQDIQSVKSIQDEKDKLNLNTNTYIVQTDWLIETLSSVQKENSDFDLLGFLEKYIRTNTCSSYEYTGYLKNINDIQSYYDANMDMLDPIKFDTLMYSKQKIYTKLKNEVPTYYAQDSLVKNSQFATGCVIEGTVEHSLVSRKTNVRPNAIVKHSIIYANVEICSDASVEYAILDKNVKVDSGVRIVGKPNQIIVIKKGDHIQEDIVGG